MLVPLQDIPPYVILNRHIALSYGSVGCHIMVTMLNYCAEVKFPLEILLLATKYPN